MPWCPICKAEYREGFNNCNDCKVPLVPALEEEANEELHIDEYDTEEFLMSVLDDNHANVIESILQQYNIPMFRRYKESGGYMKIVWARTPFGIDLYVPSKALEYSREILASNTADLEGMEEHIPLEDLDNQKDEEPYPFLNNRNVFKYLIIVLNLVSILIILILRFLL